MLQGYNVHGTHLASLDDPHIYGKKKGFWPYQPASGLLEDEQILGVLIKVRQGIKSHWSSEILAKRLA